VADAVFAAAEFAGSAVGGLGWIDAQPLINTAAAILVVMFVKNCLVIISPVLFVTDILTRKCESIKKGIASSDKYQLYTANKPL
jgi:hypothetical protein